MKLNIQLFADGKVTIETELDTKGLNSGLSKVGDIAKKGFSVFAKSAAVAAGAVTTLIGASVKAAGELEQQVGGAEAVFQSLGSTIEDIKFTVFEDGEGQLKSLKDVATDAYQTMGLSANDYLATINKMGALMQGSGLETQQAMDLSAQAMQRAADVASIMGIDVNSAMESIAGAAKGNFTMMDNLGVAMNATTIEAYALSKGITTSYNEMDNATKVGLAMEMFLEKTAYAEGNYAKENQTFAGSFTTLKAAMSNFLSGAGGIQEVSSALVNFAGILAKSIGEMAPQITEGITELIDSLIPEIPPLLAQLLPSVIDGATSLLNGLVTVFPAVIQLIQDNLPTIVQGAMTIVKTFITTILKMLPDILKLGIDLIVELANGIAEQLPELIPLAIDTILILIETLLDNIDLIIDAGINLIIALAEGLMNALPILIDKAPLIIEKLLSAILTNLPKLLQLGIQLIAELVKGLVKSIPAIVAFVPKMFMALLNAAADYFVKLVDLGKDMVDKIKNGFANIKDVGKNLVKGLWNGIGDQVDWILDKIKGFGKKVISGMKKIFGISSPSKVFRDEIGKFLAEGIGVGFEDEIDDVYRDMQNAIDFNTDKMSANVQTNGTYQMAMAGLPEFNLLDNTENTTQLVVNGKVLAEVVNTENKYREVAKA